MKVFISHTTSDTSFAKELAQALKDAGLEPWLAEWALLPGDNWGEAIGRGLSEADAMVVLLTPESMQNRWVRNEIMYAVGEERFEGRLLPVVIGSENDLPAEQMPWVLKTLQWLKARKGEERETARRIVAALTPAMA